MRREGWQQALDIQMGIHKWSLTELGFGLNAGLAQSIIIDGDISRKDDPITMEAGVQIAHNYVQSLWRGDTMYITSEMLHLIMQAAEDLPDDDAILDEKIIMAPYGFVQFEEALVGKDRHGKTILTHGLVWGQMEITPSDRDEDLERCIMIYFLVDPYDTTDEYNDPYLDPFKSRGIPPPPLVLQHIYPWKYDEPIPAEQRGVQGFEPVLEMLKIFLVMNMLSHQTIGEPVMMRPDRATRKRMARDYPELPEKMITLITLRRKNVKHDKEPGTVEWSRRWVVRGHWRKQWYPKTKVHGWKYIYEYVKGPEDKPLVTSRRIFNFRR